MEPLPVKFRRVFNFGGWTQAEAAAERFVSCGAEFLATNGPSDDDIGHHELFARLELRLGHEVDRSRCPLGWFWSEGDAIVYDLGYGDGPNPTVEDQIARWVRGHEPPSREADRSGGSPTRADRR